MRRNSMIITIILFALSCLHAENQSLKQAEKLYAQKKYSEAASIYENILKKDGVAPEIYYNLGNAYFKSNETGLAILNYERALRISPIYEDVKHNLEFANQKVVDNVLLNEPFFLKKWIDLLMKLLTSDAWFLLGVLLFVLTLGFLMFFIFGRSLPLRKTGFYLSVLFFILTVASVVFSAIRYGQSENHNEAIILSGAVVVKSSPDKSGTDLFQLHEGTKVEIQSELESWFEIRLGNGNIGWIEARHLEKI